MYACRPIGKHFAEGSFERREGDAAGCTTWGGGMESAALSQFWERDEMI